jgi:transcriptional regulator of acetoin/glycerol metabolism
MDDEQEPLQKVIDRVTEQQVRAALKTARGSVNVAAEALGVDRATVYRMMRRYGIEITRVVA